VVWKLLAPSGTCPPLGDLADVKSKSLDFLDVTYKAFRVALKVRLLGSLS